MNDNFKEFLSIKDGRSKFLDETSTFSNNVLDENSKFVKGSIMDEHKAGEIQAVYPLIRACHSEKLNKNYRFFPENCLKGTFDSRDPENATGYSSFMYPFPKPVIIDHRSGGGWTEAVEPDGRTISAIYKRHERGTDLVTPKDETIPGYVNGRGYIEVVAKISNPEAIDKVLTERKLTVSIGGDAKNIYESISGVDLLECYANERYEDVPPYQIGKRYTIDGKKQLSYLIYDGLMVDELSFVNRPADGLAQTATTDVGEEEANNMVLIAKKKLGIADSYDFFNIVDKKEYKIDQKDFVGAHITDSIKTNENIFVVDNTVKNPETKPTPEEIQIAEDAAKAIADQVAKDAADALLIKEATKAKIQDQITKIKDGGLTQLFKITDTAIEGINPILSSKLTDEQIKAIDVLINENELDVTNDELVEGLADTIKEVTALVTDFKKEELKIKINGTAYEINDEFKAKFEVAKTYLGEATIKSIQDNLDLIQKITDAKDLSELTFDEVSAPLAVTVDVFALTDGFEKSEPESVKLMLTSLLAVCKDKKISIKDFADEASKFNLLTVSSLVKLIKNQTAGVVTDTAVLTTAPPELAAADSVDETDNNGKKVSKKSGISLEGALHLLSS